MKWLSIIAASALFPSIQGARSQTMENPIISLPLSVKSSAAQLSNFLYKDRQRVNSLIQRLSSRSSVRSKRVVSSVAATSNVVAYTANVGIGCPATQYTLNIDSSTPFTSVNTYNPTSCSHQVTPPAGTIGQAYTDTITLSSSLVASGEVLVASNTPGIQLLGLGPGNGSIVTTLFNQGSIPANQVAYSFEPSNQTSSTNGELTFGGVDSSKYSGNITYTPTTSILLGEGLWGFEQSVSYGNGTLISSSTSGIVDTGTSLLYLATDAFQKYQTATGAVLDSTNGFLKLTNTQLAALKSLSFVVGGTTFEFTANAQLFPRALNAYIGGTSTANYLVVSDLGAVGGSGLDFHFISGVAWMERFYTVLDNGNERIGFASTPFTNANVN